MYLELMSKEPTMLFYPETFEWLWNFSGFGKIFFLIMGIAGFILGCYVWEKIWGKRITALTSVFVFLGTATIYLLTIWILKIDPNRNLGSIPLPYFWRILTNILVIIFMITGYSLQGIALSLTLKSIRNKHLLGWSLINLVSVLFSIWCIPWAVGVILD